MLTTVDDIKGIRDIAANLKDARLAPYLKECEDAYIMPALGADLYERLDNKIETDETLLNGGYYNKADGARAYCHGIRRAVAYFAYARVLRNNQVNVTAFGVVNKTGSYSQQAESAQVESAATDAIKMAEVYLHSCIEYLHREDDCKCGKRHPGQPSDTKLHVQILS